MAAKVIYLSGMPASGKDTVTRLICAHDPGFVFFQKHRGTAGAPKEGYYNISPADFAAKVVAGDFLEYHGRYGRQYGVDRTVLLAHLAKGEVPIIHIGRIENYFTLRDAVVNACGAEGVHILLWAPYEELCARIRARDGVAGDAKARMTAMREEFCDVSRLMHGASPLPYDAAICNWDAEVSARALSAFVRGEGETDGLAALWQYITEEEEKWMTQTERP